MAARAKRPGPEHVRPNTGLLEGITVVELGQFLSVPLAARLLSDLGADVIKVEPPEGDIARRVPPFTGAGPGPDSSVFFQHLNLNKRGVTLDVRRREGQEALLRLLERADLFIEGQRPCDMKEWGLDFAFLSRLFPRLCIISVTPFGQTGPYRNHAGTDLVVWAMCGLAMANPRHVASPDLSPLRLPGYAADNCAGWAAAAGAASALLRQRRTGEGAHIDVSALDIMMGIQHVGLAHYHAVGKIPPRSGPTGALRSVPYGLFPCKDGWVGIFVVNDSQWDGMVRAMGSPGWATAGLFKSYQARAEHGPELLDLVQAWVSPRSMYEIFDACQRNSVPACAVLSFKDVAAHPQFVARRAWRDMEHPQLGKLPVLRPPFLTPGVDWRPRRPAPQLGEHNEEILQEYSGLHAPPACGPEHVAMARPLADFRILELGSAAAAPYCGTICASWGAEVVKAETRRRPDNMRFVSKVDPAPEPLDGGLIFNALNRDKLGILLDLTTPEGRGLFLDLVQTADAVVENFAAGTMERFGLGYDVLRRQRPDLVMLSLSGFGATGPFKDKVAYGIVLEGTSGLMGANGYAGGPPVETPFIYNDYITAFYAAQLMAAALYRRLRTGEAFYADLAEAEVTLHLVHQGVFDWMLNERNQERRGNHDDFSPVHGCYPCKGEDAWVAVVAAGAGPDWQGLCQAIRREDWLRDPSLATREGRIARRDELEAALSQWTRQRTPKLATETLQKHGVAAGPAYTIDQALDDPHVRARGVIVPEALHPHTRDRLVPAPPLRFVGDGREVRYSAPTWGRDNSLVVGELLGLEGEEVARLAEARVLQ